MYIYLHISITVVSDVYGTRAVVCSDTCSLSLYADCVCVRVSMEMMEINVM